MPGTSRPIGSSEKALTACLERFQEIRWDYSTAQLEELRGARVVRAQVDGERAMVGPEDIRGLESVQALP